MLRGIVRFFTTEKNFRNADGILNHVNGLLAKSISKLEEEFRQLVISYRFSPLDFFSAKCIHSIANSS